MLEWELMDILLERSTELFQATAHQRAKPAVADHLQEKTCGGDPWHGVVRLLFTVC